MEDNAELIGRGPIRESVTVERIKNAYHYDESLGFIVYAPRGYGKTSWSVQVASKCIGTTREPDWEGLKRWLIFTPQEFCAMITKVYNTQIVLVWDDAGYWLNRLFWYDEFVKEALRYMTLQRTQFSCIIFSTPSLSLLPNKILELEDILRVRVIKLFSNSKDSSRKRLAWVKKPWYSDDQTKHGVSTAYREWFSALMPDDFYNWYQPVRKKYTVFAAQRIQEAIDRANSKAIKMKLEDVEEEIGKTLPSQELLKDMGEVTDQHEST